MVSEKKDQENPKGQECGEKRNELFILTFIFETLYNFFLNLVLCLHGNYHCQHLCIMNAKNFNLMLLVIIKRSKVQIVRHITYKGVDILNDAIFLASHWWHCYKIVRILSSLILILTLLK